jgi:hypothetical protein
VFAYVDASGNAFGPFLFERSYFWRLMTIFDTVPLLVILGLFSLMAQADINPPGILFLTLAITGFFGTVQWFIVGGGIGALLERFWTGLKTGDDEDEEWL